MASWLPNGAEAWWVSQRPCGHFRSPLLSVGPSASGFQLCLTFLGQISQLPLGQAGWGRDLGPEGFLQTLSRLGASASGAPRRLGLCFWVVCPWRSGFPALTGPPRRYHEAICSPASRILLTSVLCHRHLPLALWSCGLTPRGVWKAVETKLSPRCAMFS